MVKNNSELDRFYRSVKRVALDDIVCIDETSLKAFMVRKYCRSPLGKRCTIKTHSQEVFKKYTGIFAITTRGCVAYEIFDSGGITAQRLLDFLRQHFAHHRNKLFVMDNASSHRNPNVKRYIERNNSLLYSVPYQHYTNAIENFFSVMKSHIQKEELAGKAALLRSIPKALDAISRQQYHNFFSGAYEREGAEKYERFDTGAYQRSTSAVSEVRALSEVQCGTTVSTFSLYPTMKKQVIRAHSKHATKYTADNDYRTLSLRTVLTQELD